MSLKSVLKGSPYSTAERRVPELIPILGSQPAGGMSHKSTSRLPLLPARSALLGRRLLQDSVAAAI